MNVHRSLMTWGLFLAMAGSPVGAAPSTDLPPGEEIVRRVNDRDVGVSSEQTLEMTLRDEGGRERKRELRTFRKFFGDEKRIALFFVAPANIEGTALLTYDYADPAKPDDQWLYLPAMRKVRRIPSSERGDAFVGTDFTYHDMNSESRANLEEQTWTTLGIEEVDGARCYRIEAVPVNDRLKKELGYAKVHLWIDADEYVLRRSDFYDGKGTVFRRIHLRDYRDESGILTPHTFEAVNLGNGHSTTIAVTRAVFNGDVPDNLFTVRAIEQGL